MLELSNVSVTPKRLLPLLLLFPDGQLRNAGWPWRRGKTSMFRMETGYVMYYILSGLISGSKGPGKGIKSIINIPKCV